MHTGIFLGLASLFLEHFAVTTTPFFTFALLPRPFAAASSFSLSTNFDGNNSRITDELYLMDSPPISIFPGENMDIEA